MNTPTPPTPPPQDPDVLKLRLAALDKQLIALDAKLDSDVAIVEANHAQQRSNFLKQKAAHQSQLEKATETKA